MFGIKSKNPKNLKADTTNTSANTKIYAKEKSGTQTRLVSHEKKEICPKYSARIGEIASVVEMSIASAFAKPFGILHFELKNFVSGVTKTPIAITLIKLIKNPASKTENGFIRRIIKPATPKDDNKSYCLPRSVLAKNTMAIMLARTTDGENEQR